MNFIKTHKFFIFCIFLGMCVVSSSPEKFPFIIYLIISFLAGCAYYYIFMLPIKLIKKLLSFKDKIKNHVTKGTSLNSKNHDNTYQDSNLSENAKKALDYYKRSSNPKFSRSDKEEDLSFNFSHRYCNQISKYENKIYDKAQSAAQSVLHGNFDIDEMIQLHEDAIKCFYEFQEFCFNKSKGGKIYFEDMWLYCHNSRNECFSYIENTENTLNELKSNYNTKKSYYENIKKVKDEIKCILNEKEEVIQKELYKQFLPLKAADIYIAINDLKEEGFLFSEKYLNTRKLIKITDIRKPTPKWSKVVEGIEPLFGYTPSFFELTNKQIACYKKIVKQISAGKFVEVGDSRSYIFLYIHEEFEKAAENNDISNVKNLLITLNNLYKDDNIFPKYINHWLADCYVISKEYDKAIEIYQAENDINSLWSLKYNLKLPIDPKEILFLSWKNYFTSFVNDKIDKIEKHLNDILNNEGIDKDYIQYLGDKHKDLKEEFHLFVGIPAGYELNKLNKDNVFINFRSIPEISELCQKICRKAENSLREEMGIPKVGEGWVSETDLYYKIKEFLSSHEVIHHFRDKWLGRQHLDIYIPALKLAFEYQGLQHSKPIDFFGGEKAFIENQKRDNLKKQKCKQAGVYLIEVYPDYDFEYIKNIINQHLNSKNV